MILFFLFHPYHYRSQQRAQQLGSRWQETSESFLAFVFCSSLISIGETNTPHKPVTKYVPNLSIILIG
jgi:hypothetical protein